MGKRLTTGELALLDLLAETAVACDQLAEDALRVRQAMARYPGLCSLLDSPLRTLDTLTRLADEQRRTMSSELRTRR